jgi:hypothetical protein
VTEPTPEETQAELDAELADMRAKDAEREAAEGQSWDAFWAEVEGPHETEIIRGVPVKVPRDLPLSFELRAEARKNQSGADAIKPLLADLFGVDVLDAWIEAGMGSREFETVLLWGMSHGKGRPISFRQAYEEAKALEEGKANAAKTPDGNASAASGGRSKRTSAANTASARKKSQT